jgi:hypothetical protein
MALFIELRISDGDGQQAPILPFEPDGGFDPGRAFEIGLDRLGVFPAFDQRADHAAGGKTEHKAERESDKSGKSECGQSGHVCDSSCWAAKYSKVAALVLFATL